MATININGRIFDFANGANVSIINGIVTVDGAMIENDPKLKNIGITITGSVGGITCDGSVSCDNVNGNVTAKGSVSCDNVLGDVCAGGSVSCDDVGGSVKAGGSIIGM